jgi:hypothetical protein
MTTALTQQPSIAANRLLYIAAVDALNKGKNVFKKQRIVFFIPIALVNYVSEVSIGATIEPSSIACPFTPD